MYQNTHNVNYINDKFRQHWEITDKIISLPGWKRIRLSKVDDDDNPIWKICVCGVETVQGCFFVTRPNTDRIFKICGGGAMVVVYIPWSMVYHGGGIPVYTLVGTRALLNCLKAAFLRQKIGTL